MTARPDGPQAADAAVAETPATAVTPAPPATSAATAPTSAPSTAPPAPDTTPAASAATATSAPPATPAPIPTPAIAPAPTPPTAPAGPGGTLCAAFQATVAERPDAVALRTPDGTESYTWRQSAAEVERLAGGLAGLGVRPGDTVALLLRNSPRFNLVDTAAVHLGAVPWSVYPTSAPDQVRYMLAGAGTRLVVCERDLLPQIERAVEGTAVERVVPADELAALPPAPPGFDFGAAWRDVRPDSPLTVIWTSGTTGEPKPVELTHGAMAAMLRALTELAGLERGGRTLSYLPSAHVADRWISLYWWMLLGMEVTCVAEGGTVAEVLPSARPTFFGSVPRVWEKLRAALEARGVRPERLTPAETEAVRRRIGLDRARFLIAGAAPLPVDTLRFFADLGLPLSEVWGMSETCGVLTVNPPGDRRAGTVGTPLAGAEVRIAADGEVLIRGPQLMRGYRGRPDLTEQAYADGWLRTGDLGAVDADGYLTITGRKKDLIINSAGKNMSPVAIEEALKTAGPLVGQACVVGDGRPYNVALLVVDPDAAAAWAAARGQDGVPYARVVADETLRKAVAGEVAAANERLSHVEQVRRWHVVDADWVADSAELTPTMKLRRSRIAEKYAAEIDRMYA